MIIWKETVVLAPSRIAIDNPYESILLGSIHRINVSRKRKCMIVLLSQLNVKEEIVLILPYERTPTVPVACPDSVVHISICTKH